VIDGPNDEVQMTNDETLLKCVRHFRIAFTLLVITSSSAFGSTKGDRSTQLSGYKAVRVHYGPLNKMIMSVRINGQPANLLVDTGSNEVILDAAAAESFGVQPSQPGSNEIFQDAAAAESFGGQPSQRSLRYIRRSRINGQLLPVGFAQSLTAGNMSFGSVLVTLRNSSRSDDGNAHVDGVLGLDVLTRYKAVINCRTKVIFFKVDPTRQMHLSGVAASEKFTRVSMRQEENGALTAPCSIHGQPARLLVDTGSFVTIFTEPVLKSLGVGLQPTHISARFPTGTSRKVSAAQINDLKIGDFKVRPGKFGVTPSPNFAPRQGSSRMLGILGMDTLYNCHAIIDLDGMNLFLK
jgi:predicted aspartyl protease